jgi:chemotaxis protein CheD
VNVAPVAAREEPKVSQIAGPVVIVGMAELRATDRPEDVLVTYSLGSCIGLALYDPVRRVGGMVHTQMPLSRLDLAEARARPGKFTDTGVTALLEAVYALGAARKDLVARVAGGASPLNDAGVFKVGERNCLVLRRLLWKNGIFIANEDVGGTTSRTLRLYVATGRVTVTSPDRVEVEL